MHLQTDTHLSWNKNSLLEKKNPAIRTPSTKYKPLITHAHNKYLLFIKTKFEGWAGMLEICRGMGAAQAHKTVHGCSSLIGWLRANSASTGQSDFVMHLSHLYDWPHPVCTDMFVCWLLNAPATCECTSGTDLLWQFYLLPHWDRSCSPNCPSHQVTVYWHRADQSQRWPYNARRLAG